MSFERTRLLLGPEMAQKLENAHVTVCGLGGVGSYAVEALARAGIGHLTLIDCDTVTASNINRQLFALESTVGIPKTEIARKRVLDIHPACQLTVMYTCVDEHSNPQILSRKTDVLVDAIDSLSAKVHLIANAHEKAIHVVSSMGAAGRMDANAIITGDLSETHTCPLARFVRIRLHRRNIYTGIRCVFSTEPPMMKKILPDDSEPSDTMGKKAPVIGSISYMPSIFGLKAAFETINHILGHRS
ncbi:MAG: tRNA threonylcarbamoyladenosine dehydratase [Proteobacteria bacterium]|nr:tRNA threonylcarbamoyladenosine dehydratase [Pseudomonadota bacterium]